MMHTALLRTLCFTILALLPCQVFSAAEVVVLDIEQVHVGATKYKEQYEQLKKEFEEAQAGLYADVDSIEALNNQLQITPQSSPQHVELKEKIEVAKFKVNLAKKRIEEQLKAKRFNLIKETTEDLRKELKNYCEEKGHKVVLSTLSGPLQSNSTEQLRLEMNQLNALYGADSHNITDDFIGWLNAKGGDKPEAKADNKNANGGADIKPVE